MERSDPEKVKRPSEDRDREHGGLPVTPQASAALSPKAGAERCRRGQRGQQRGAETIGSPAARVQRDEDLELTRTANRNDRIQATSGCSPRTGSCSSTFAFSSSSILSRSMSPVRAARYSGGGEAGSSASLADP
jgi:hypothetical protein